MASKTCLAAFSACVLTTSLLGATGAIADDNDGYGYGSDNGFSERHSESVWSDPAVSSGIGVGVNVGGGVTGFVGSRLRATTGNVGGMWSFRAAFGTHTPLALELGYIGSSTAINGQLGRAQATMMGTTVESSLRFTVLPRAIWSPYVFAGLGYQRFTIDDRTFQLSDTGIRTRDDLLVMPLGVGAAYRIHSFVADVRGTFRAAAGSNLVLNDPKVALETGNGTYAPMHSWDASLNVGYEF